MQVRDLMNPSVVTITPQESASLAARLLSRHNLGALPVCGNDGGLRGIVTDRDIVLRCIAAEDDPAQTQVKDIMTRNCAVVSPDDDAREATRLMAARQVRRLPVLEGGKVVGMVSLGDLVIQIVQESPRAQRQSWRCPCAGCRARCRCPGRGGSGYPAGQTRPYSCPARGQR